MYNEIKINLFIIDELIIFLKNFFILLYYKSRCREHFHS